MKIILDYIKRVLGSPFLFNLFETVVGVGAARKRLVNNFIIPFDGASILDIGCGTGVIIDYLPDNIKYVGFDLSSKYIDYAKNKYKKQGKFYCEDINKISNLQPNTFDFVISIGVIHLLNNNEGKIDYLLHQIYLSQSLNIFYEFLYIVYEIICLFQR